jgi:hypothetical protein
MAVIFYVLRCSTYFSIYNRRVWPDVSDLVNFKFLIHIK